MTCDAVRAPVMKGEPAVVEGDLTEGPMSRHPLRLPDGMPTGVGSFLGGSMTNRWTFLVLMTASLSCAHPHEAPKTSSGAPVSDGRDAVLETLLQGVVAEHDGTVGVSVLHLGTGARASVHGNSRLPMMSVFKLPLAVVALTRIQQGSLRFEQQVPITEPELRPGVSPIAEAWEKGERSPTLETILRRTLQDSDNTGGDKLVSLLGGGPAITTGLRTFGLLGIDVAEQEIEIFARVHCPGDTAPAQGWTFPAIRACPDQAPAVHLAAARREIDSSPNAATADSLVAMLAMLETDKILTSTHRTWLKDTLAGTTTGPARLKGKLPAATRVEHKTGTGETIQGLTIATNDVGVVTLPNGERFAIAVLTAGSRRDVAGREGVIAALARVAWDRFAAH